MKQLTEKVLVVNAVNCPVNCVLREQLAPQFPYIRISTVILTNRKSEFYVQRRAQCKETFPLYWEIATGGLVREGETDEQAAIREIKEELGVSALRLRRLCALSVAQEGWFYWVVFFHLQ